MYGKKKKVGKYTVFLDQRLGKGASASVYKGINEETNSPVAVKMINAKQLQSGDPYYQRALDVQVQIHKKLNSEYIIKLYENLKSTNNIYLILQFADGGTLGSIMEKNGRFDQKTTRSYLIQILNGFGVLSKNGIIHRDLKPHNVLIKNDILKIADFGFAKQAEITKLMTTLVGTITYMAPQILLGQKYTYKCDIWSLGVMVYQMIVGRIPWTFAQKRDINDFSKEIMTRKIVFPQEIQISQNMKKFILGCLCIDQSKRYDWDQVFQHDLFGDKFATNNLSKSESTKISFIMSKFRMSLHSKNINLEKFFKTRGEFLTKADFINVIKFIHNQITQEQLILLYDCLADKDTKIQINDFKKFLSPFQCQLTGMNFQNILKEQDPSRKDTKIFYEILNRLKNKIQLQKFDIIKFFRPKAENKQDYFKIDQFSKRIHLIDESMNEGELQILFSQFDVNTNKRITNDQFFKGICKIAQIVPMQEQN